MAEGFAAFAVKRSIVIVTAHVEKVTVSVKKVGLSVFLFFPSLETHFVYISF